MATKKADTAGTKQTKKTRTPQAHFVVFDRTTQGATLVDTIKVETLKSGLIADSEMSKLKAHAKVRNREVQCVNALAMSVWKPLAKGGNEVLTPEMVGWCFEAVVENGVEVDKIHFELANKFKVYISNQAIRNALNGKTHKKVVVPRNLRQKYAAMAAENAPEVAPKSGGNTISTKLKVVLLIELGGKSGSEAGEEVDVTSSTANTWHRMFFGRYRNGDAVPEADLPKWVFKARSELKTAIEADEEGKFEPNDRIKELLGLE